MKSRSFRKPVVGSGLAGAALAAALGLSACAMQRSDADNPANLKTETASAELRSDRIRNWTVIDDQTLLIEGYDGTRYKAETMGACNGLSFATRLGFSNRGGFKTVDRFSSIQLPDGTRCPLAAFNKVITPEKSALDSYEKAEKERDAAPDGKDKQADAQKPDAQQADDAAKKTVSDAGDAQETATPR
jgi:uncharacterized protein DUF6491